MLPRVYESLKKQTFKQFEWVIVDDGSTDSTKDLVLKWIGESDCFFPIRYVWQENGHKKKAFNRGVIEANGHLLVPLDSDDEAVPSALARFAELWFDIDSELREFHSGVYCLCASPEGEVIGDEFPSDLLDSNLLEITHRYRVSGEKWVAMRTDLLRSNPYPERLTGHVPESIVWNRISRKYTSRFVNEPLRIYHSSPDSIMATGKDLMHYQGHYEWTVEILNNELEWFWHNPLWFLKAAINNTRFRLGGAIDASDPRFSKLNCLQKFLVKLMFPAGFLRYIVDRIRLSASA